MAKGEPPRCFVCHKIITFSDQFIGKNGKKIPLDPETDAPHDCPMREKPFERTSALGQAEVTKEQLEDKDDHGNEDLEGFSNLKIIKEMEERKQQVLRGEYVDHTVARPSKVKIFHAENSDLVELAYNEFLQSKTFQWTRAQLGAKGNEWAIALYYEETT